MCILILCHNQLCDFLGILTYRDYEFMILLTFLWLFSNINSQNFNWSKPKSQSKICFKETAKESCQTTDFLSSQILRNILCIYFDSIFLFIYFFGEEIFLLITTNLITILSKNKNLISPILLQKFSYPFSVSRALFPVQKELFSLLAFQYNLLLNHSWPFQLHFP